MTLTGGNRVRKFNKIWKSVAALSIGALALTACGEGDGTGDNGGEDKGELTIGVFNGWEEGIAVSYLWKHILEEEGYTVNLEEAEPAVVFSGVATQDYDFTMDVWEPTTHASYLDEYGDDLEMLGTWNDESSLQIAVNEDAPIDSLEELADNADEFDNRIVGIEPGAGLTSATEDEVIPTYGLDGMEFTTSSTPAMLQELNTAIDNDENIVVTLWRPHWAYEAFPVRDLEDPEGALGGSETMSTYAYNGFSDDFSEVSEWLSDFTMENDLLYDLEAQMFADNDDEGEYENIVADWVAENQDYVDSLTEGGDSEDNGDEEDAGDEE
ncbi:glycine betaine ABC transporter substrate-binding protein [Auritidibacter sp. NML130574]|nr:glycine betaine ABC transporter substrate-binding protein [Auritidibacter sp. NML130574]PXA81239.1 glycine/betaine ABC transporter substrate-binding protein [Auritidibacter sp. NML120779]